MSEETKQGELSRREFLKDAGMLVGTAAIGSTALIAAAPAQTVSAQATAGVTLEVLDPSGSVEVTQTFAPRLDSLEGKTICELTDAEWEYDRTFPVIRELLQKQFPTAKFIPYDKFPKLMGKVPSQDPSVGKVLKEAGCDAVIVGNAG